MSAEAAAEYYSNDFEWEDLRREVENDPSLAFHFSPFRPSLSISSSSSSPDYSDASAWSRFHTRHSTGKFFKERRYLLKEFPELVSRPDCSKVLEVGCGNGSTILPILRGKEKIIVYACDCSIEALEKTKENLVDANIVGIEDRVHPFCCDFSKTGFPKWLACDSCRQMFSEKLLPCYPEIKENEEALLNNFCSSDECQCCVGGMDMVTLVFTLSAVPVERMPRAITECFSVLKPGGMLFFRDYGLYDMTMFRFDSEKRLGFREYMRSDGTRSYFFSLDAVRDLFVGAGFTEVELDYFSETKMKLSLLPFFKETNPSDRGCCRGLLFLLPCLMLLHLPEGMADCSLLSSSEEAGDPTRAKHRHSMLLSAQYVAVFFELRRQPLCYRTERAFGFNFG
ncbi:hypothetical protein Nepgr_001426 [Nepenthes gracilis]|uniref:Methyltransferase-like protein n=1 Tax=Nepenthes gracilis TaxID=150966 RepID=A0AAD3P8I0_NEPGR|nr:hypothetical protein Nepgr_001426 [Nepenthes gracilis]